MNDKTKCFMLGEDTETYGEGKKIDIPDLQKIKEMLIEDFNCITLEEWLKLLAYDASKNKNSFAGNKLVWKYYFLPLSETRYKNQKTFWERYEADPQKAWMDVCKMDRRKKQPPGVRDLWEKNRAITFFKPSTAKYLTQHFEAKKVFDPCAGWGGRSLGVVSAGASYTGFDTNPKVKESHDQMWKDIGGWEIPSHIINESFEHAEVLTAILSEGEYDLALTSPPYGNLEVYEEMTPFKDDDDYYKNFLIPMLELCDKMCKVSAINVSPKIYEKLTTTYGYRECDEKIDFKQQLGQKQGKKQDYVYIWR
jgi:hypothetical protein